MLFGDAITSVQDKGYQITGTFEKDRYDLRALSLAICEL
jgi:hypothetical protein